MLSFWKKLRAKLLGVANSNLTKQIQAGQMSAADRILFLTENISPKKVTALSPYDISIYSLEVSLHTLHELIQMTELITESIAQRDEDQARTIFLKSSERKLDLYEYLYTAHTEKGSIMLTPEPMAQVIKLFLEQVRQFCEFLRFFEQHRPGATKITQVLPDEVRESAEWLRHTAPQYSLTVKMFQDDLMQVLSHLYQISNRITHS